jgi:hypothetical protein
MAILTTDNTNCYRRLEINIFHEPISDENSTGFFSGFIDENDQEEFRSYDDATGYLTQFFDENNQEIFRFEFSTRYWQLQHDDVLWGVRTLQNSIKLIGYTVPIDLDGAGFSTASVHDCVGSFDIVLSYAYENSDPKIFIDFYFDLSSENRARHISIEANPGAVAQFAKELESEIAAAAPIWWRENYSDNEGVL